MQSKMFKNDYDFEKKEDKSFKNDYEFGKMEETKVFDLIKEFFYSDNIIKVLNRYSKFDFEGDNFVYELKSRTCYSSTYESTIIGVDKIFENFQKKQIFLFNFRDGLYYIEYDSEKFKKYRQEIYKRKYRSDFNDKKVPYFFIDIEDLILIDLNFKKKII